MRKLRELDYVDLPTEAEAIVGLVRSRRVREAYEAVPPDHWGVTLESAEKLARPSATDRALKENLWRSVRRAVMNLEEIRVIDIYGGSCTAPHFYNRIQNPRKLVWMLACPPSDDLRIQSIYPRALERFRDILELPLLDEDGRPNVHVMKAIFTAMELSFKYLSPQQKDRYRE